MTQTRRPNLPRTRALPWLAPALLGALLSGCDQRSDARKTYDDAARDAMAQGVGSPTVEVAADRLKGPTQQLQQAAAQAGTGEKAGAALVAAQTALARAETLAADASRAEQDVRRSLTALSSLSSQWSIKSAIAATARAFDPAPQIAELDRSIAEKDALIASLTQERDTLAAHVQDLTARAKVGLAAADALMREAATLNQKAASVSAREGVTFVEQAAVKRRESDRRRLAGETLQADAELVAPQLVELETTLAQYSNQKTSFLAMQQTLRQKQQSALADADAAEQAAGRAAQDIDHLVASLNKSREENFETAFQGAVKGFEEALRNAKQAAQEKSAAGDPRLTGKIMAGSAQISLAGMHMTRAQQLRTLSGTLDLLALVNPPLPRRADYAQQSQQALADSKAAIDASRTAVEQARSSFSGVPARGAMKDRLTKLGEVIATLEQSLGGQSADVPDPAPQPELVPEAEPAQEPPPAEPPAEEPATPAPDPQSP